MGVRSKAGHVMVLGEAELLRRAREGDEQAFGRLVEACLDQSYGLALRITGHTAEAEDALQDALYKAWRALPGFRGDSKFSTWLYRIVWRVCVDRMQKGETLPLDVDLEDPRDEYDPQKRWEDVETRREVERALMQLPVAYRTVLTLFYIEDLPVREIAEILELPIGTVKTHLHRARRALQKVLPG